MNGGYARARTAMLTQEAQAVFLQHMPLEVAIEMDRRYGLVKTGHVSVHKNDGEAVSFEHRDVGKPQKK